MKKTPYTIPCSLGKYMCHGDILDELFFWVDKVFTLITGVI